MTIIRSIPTRALTRAETRLPSMKAPGRRMKSRPYSPAGPHGARQTAGGSRLAWDAKG